MGFTDVTTASENAWPCIPSQQNMAAIFSLIVQIFSNIKDQETRESGMERSLLVLVLVFGFEGKGPPSPNFLNFFFFFNFFFKIAARVEDR